MAGVFRKAVTLSHFVRNTCALMSQHTIRNLRMHQITTLPKICSECSTTPFTRSERQICLSSVRQQDTEDLVDEENEETKPDKFARQRVDVETSIQYMKSAAFKKTYGDKLVWESYRRNFKGHIPPTKTRKTCIRKGVLATGNPCPICRDEYLVVDVKNIALLEQFVSPYTGQLLSFEKTGVCQRQHRNLTKALLQAWDQGSLEMPLSHKHYDYRDYYNFEHRKTADGKE